MKRMTKNLVKTLLMGDYMDALAYFASKLEKFATSEGMENELNRIDDKVMEWCEEFEEETFNIPHDVDDDDYYDNMVDFQEVWMRIYSGLMCCID